MVWGGRLGGTVATIVTDRLRGDGTMIVVILMVVDSPDDAIVDDWYVQPMGFTVLKNPEAEF